jgi:Ca2+/Na+ antiporter
MHCVAATSPRLLAFAMMLAGAVALYVASLVGVRALAGRDPSLVGRRAVGHWLPILCVALAAAVLRRADLAVGVILATCVSSLSLMLGILAYFAPLDEHPAARRGWPFVLPAALLALLAGFSGALSFVHAGMLLLLGAAVWSVWSEQPADPASDLFSALDSPADLFAALDSPAERRGPTTVFLLLVALALAAGGAYLAAAGAARASESSRFLPAGLLAAAVLAPLLTMPMLATSSAMAERGESSSMAGTLVAVVLLNLCLTLPAVVVVWHVQPGVTEVVTQVMKLPSPESTVSSQPAIDERYTTVERPLFGVLGTKAEPMPYPMAAWRIDTVLVLVLGFALIPIALGRWPLGRTEAGGLIIAYAIYLALTMRTALLP